MPVLAVIAAVLVALVIAGAVARRVRRGSDAGGEVRRSPSPRVQLESFMTVVHDAIVVMNAAGEIVAWNRGATAHFGYDADEVTGTSIWSKLAPGREDEYGALFRAIAEQRLVPPDRPIEILAVRRDGSKFPAELSTSVWHDGQLPYVVCIFRDVSERHHMEAELRASTELFEGVLHGASESSIIATDEAGMITVFNPGAARLLGYAPDEALETLHLVDFHDPAELAARAVELRLGPGLDVLVHAARRGDAETREWTYVGKNGTRVPVSLTITALTTDGALRGYVAVAHDLSAQRRAERDIALASETFRAAFDSAPTAIILTRPDRTCHLASPSFCELTGYSEAELASMSMLDLIEHPDDSDDRAVLQREAATFARLVNGEMNVHNSERRIRRRDGSMIWVRERTSIIRDEDGGLLLWVTHLEDITQEQQVQHALQDALARKVEALDRLEEIDRAKSDFVSMVSHELRSPVTSIIGYIELLLDGSYGELSARHREALGVIERNSVRLEQLIADLMTLSKLETGAHAQFDAVPVDVGALVANVSSSMRPIIERRNLCLTVDIDDVGTVHGDERQLEHVITNLLTNAIKFTGEQGSIDVTARRDGAAIVVTVHDTGCGIPADELAKVFRRFYRGRAAERAHVPGTGLGLAIVQAIVRNHDGNVSIQSEEGVGTTVTLALPGGEPADAAVDEERSELRVS